MTATTTLLSASQLGIGYRTKGQVHAVAEALELALQAGEFVCLLGPNGAGKSTLIRTLAGMQPALSGTLQLNQQDFNEIAPRERARLVSVVLTETVASGMMDAYSLVSLGRHPYSGWLGGLNATDRARIDAAFQAVGAQDLASRQVAELSDGERQKVSIARALAQESKVMLLDEPTAFLDLPRRVELMMLLRNLAHREQMGLLLSTHDLDLALRFADRLWVMTSQGQLIQGYPEALALSGEFAKVFASNNLDWDAELGSFRAHPTPCLFVHMVGAGIAHNWTRRALERLGFGITAVSQQAIFSVIINEHGAGANWTIAHAEKNHCFGSVRALIDWIQSEDWSV
ncbi:MAG: iron complex transport system ATP-binding protein [Lentimonas sp.]|jgi:iron complex transport system ATP-binding protein